MLRAVPGAAYLLVGLGVVFGATTGSFATPANLVNVVLQAAVLTVLALGMTLVMLTEGIDLSMGPVLGLAGVAAGLLLVAGWPLALAMTVALWFNDGVVLGLPVPIWATAGLFVVTWVLLYHTRFGRYVFALGGNRRALGLMGVSVRAWHVAVYALAGT